jgi:predicted secreted protein
MKRSRKIVVVCHCLLNANSKVYPLASWPGACLDVLRDHLEAGVGLFQLPCPEAGYLGMNRWGMTREQYDHSNFRSHCRAVLRPAIDQLEAFHSAGYEIADVIGMDGSPNCGVDLTCEGYRGGEICSPADVEDQVKSLRFVPGRGVFMEILAGMLDARQIDVPFSAVREDNPS